jgi:hypothetical protein
MEVSKWLGYGTFTLTLDVYSDYTPDEDGGALDTLPGAGRPAKPAERWATLSACMGDRRVSRRYRRTRSASGKACSTSSIALMIAVFASASVGEAPACAASLRGSPNSCSGDSGAGVDHLLEADPGESVGAPSAHWIRG